MAALLALAGFGLARLGEADPADVAGVKLRIMQPDTTIDASFNYAHKDAIVRHYLDLSDRATSPTSTGLADVTHLVWPESAFPFILSRDAEALSTIGAALPPKTTLITGAARLEVGPLKADGRPAPLYFNAIQVIASGGSILDTYDKVHLVPFGEFLPLQSLLEALGIPRFVDVPGGFEAGTSRRLLSVPGLPPVAAIVCYEAIFSGEVVPPEAAARGVRPGLLLNVTNDAWFGFTPGPYQHFAQARLRAIEEGLPLVRSASTGVSGIVDAHGRIRAILPLGADAVIDGPLPGALPPTPFARGGNTIPLIMMAAFFICALALRRLSLK
jgi:apolipoprotein N-acyltransferase